MTAVRSLFQTCTPREDVLSGVLPDAVFAANLDAVVNEDPDAPDAYRDAETFFSVTHPSVGLKSLLNESLGRISGNREGAPPVIRLETNLGGGKTHNLIALWHVAAGRLDPLRAVDFMDAANVPARPVERVAAFVGTEIGATSFPEFDGVAPKTLWGHLAVRLGGAAAYEHVRDADENLSAAGAAAFQEIIGDEPALIMIDELARYLTVASGHQVGDSTLARQTVAFLMALMEAVDRSPKASLVITTTAVTDAFGDQTEGLLEAMTETSALLSRKEHVIRPAEETDLPRILARRLFAEVDSTHATTVGKAYAEAANEAYGRGFDVPEEMTRASFAQTVADSWPFHPSLIEVLDKRLSTIPNFNRTRGALRLLADTVRTLWKNEPTGTLAIHGHHIDLGDSSTVEELTSRLNRGAFEPVVRADIAAGSGRSHAEEVDEKLGSPFAKQLATTAYVWSLTEQIPGISTADLLGAVFAPKVDHNVLQRSLDQLEDACWYLHGDERGWRFSTEASLVKLVQETQARITAGRVRQEATDILGRQFRNAALTARRSWEDGRVPDREDDAALVIMHWDEFGDARGIDPNGDVPEKITEVWEKTPSGGIRQFRNRLVFLAPSLGTHEHMLDAVRRHLALKALEGETETVKSLTAEKRQELKKLSQESDLLARVAVCNHVNVLVVPQRDGLVAEELAPVSTSSVPPNQTDAIVERLAALDKTLAAGDPPLDPALIKSRLGAKLDQPITTTDFAREFARRSDLKLVLDSQQLVTLVRSGVQLGAWEYHDRAANTWATQERPGTYVLRDDTELHPPGSAPSVEQPPCPMCGHAHGAGACPSEGGGGESPQRPNTTVFTGSGSAATATANAVQAARDESVPTLTRLVIDIDETGNDLNQQLARLHSVVPPNSGADIVYAVRVDAGLGSPGRRLSVDFVGDPGEWAHLKAGLDQIMRTHPSTLQASVTAEWAESIPLDSEFVDAVVQRAADTGPANCTVRLEGGAGE